MERIIQFKGKFITLDKIQELYHIEEHSEIVILIKRLREQGVIEPIKTSGWTAKYERIHLKYRIIKHRDEEKEEAVKELSYSFHPDIEIDFYRKHPDKYLSVRSELLKLNDYLFQHPERINHRMSINERSYDIFQDEKYLVNKGGETLLRNIGMDVERDLNVYRTPEPFFYQSINREGNQKVLIMENKDSYVTCNKLFMENSLILGEDFSTVIYGEGKKIISSLSMLGEDATLSYLMDKRNIFYYWGDIDKTGLFIMGELVNKVDFLKIIPFEKAYELMIEKSELVQLRKSKNQIENYQLGLDKISNSELKQKIESVIEQDEYIPQEILHFVDLGGK